MSSLVELVDQAFARAGMSQKAAASFMRIDQSQLSRALSGSGALSLQKLELMPPKFWRLFIELLAERYGLTVKAVDRRKVAITKLVSALQELLAEEAKE